MNCGPKTSDVRPRRAARYFESYASGAHWRASAAASVRSAGMLTGPSASEPGRGTRLLQLLLLPISNVSVSASYDVSAGSSGAATPDSPGMNERCGRHSAAGQGKRATARGRQPGGDSRWERVSTGARG